MTSRDTFTVELHPADATRDAVLRAIHAATEDRYAIVGEMAAPDDEMLLLARSNQYGQLVTFAARPTSWRGVRTYVLTVAPVRRAPQIGDVMPLAVERQEASSEPVRSAPPPLRLETSAPPPAAAPTPPTPVIPIAAASPPPPQRDEVLAERAMIESAGEDGGEKLDDHLDEQPDEQPDEQFDERPPAPEPVRAESPLILLTPTEVAAEELDPEWAQEMKSYQGWRAHSRLALGGAIAAALFFALIALAMRPGSKPDVVTSEATGATATAEQPSLQPAVTPAPPAEASATEEPTPPPPAPAASEDVAQTVVPTAAAPARRRVPTRARPRATSAENPFGDGPAAARATPARTSPPPDATAKPAVSAAPRQCVTLVEARDWSDAIPACRREALMGDAEAQAQLGLAHERGQGVRQNHGEAVAWFRKAAAQGHAWSENHLGWMYASGAGVPRDDTQAVRWFRLAAERGNAEAQFNLGFMYHRGRGVPRSLPQATEWYRKAAAQGNEAAAKALRAAR